MLPWICSVTLFLGMVPARRTEETGFLSRSLVVASSLYRYQVYVPPIFTRLRTLPVILYLHGADSGGRDGFLPTKGCLGSAVRADPDRWPFLIVFPQIPPNERWMGRHASAAVRILDDAIAEFEADPSRVFITGFSLGASGAWYIAAENPRRFAAVVPVDGRVRLPEHVVRPTDISPQTATLLLAPDPIARLADLLRDTPIWVFHGARDQVVPVEDAREIVGALQSLNALVRYSEVPEGEHECATAYGDPRLPKWLLAQPRTSPAAQEPAAPD
jgi:predicted peptidase